MPVLLRPEPGANSLSACVSRRSQVANTRFGWSSWQARVEHGHDLLAVDEWKTHRSSRPGVVGLEWVFFVPVCLL